MKINYLYASILWVCVLTQQASIYSKNPCIEGGPYYGDWSGWSCTGTGFIGNKGVLSYDEQVVCVDGSAQPPELEGATVLNGSKKRTRSYSNDCSSGGTETSNATVTYSLEEKWVPSIPEKFEEAGEYVFKKFIRAKTSDSACSSSPWEVAGEFTVKVGGVQSITINGVKSETDSPGEAETVYVSVGTSNEVEVSATIELANAEVLDCITWSPEPENVTDLTATFIIKVE